MIPLWVKNRGEQITDSATFRWLAQDAGSGAVDLTLLKGSGSATFTRAGATATTVLSTGLVSSAISANTARSYYDPAPTGGTGSYMYLPGVSGAYASTPDSSANSITGDIDIRVQVALDDWTPANNQYLIAKDDAVGPDRAYAFFMNSGSGGNLRLVTSANGTTMRSAISTAATGFSDGSTNWVRVTRSATTGDVTFYTSSDGNSWTQLGNVVSTTAEGIINSAFAIGIGASTGGASNFTSGKIYRAQLYNGINGTLVADFDPTRTTQASTSFSASTGETWTINGRGFVYAAPAYLGYLAEEARTNLCLQSEALNVTWGTTDVTPGGSITGPNGATVTVNKLQEGTATSSHSITQSIAKAASAIAYSCSVWLKAGERTRARVILGNGATTAYHSAFIDLSNGTTDNIATVGFTSASTSVVTYPNGWYRLILNATSDTDTAIRVSIFNVTTGTTTNYTGVSNNGIYAWGVQLEAGSFATSYIPTAAATSTRAADVMTFASAGNAITTSGSVFARVTPFSLNAISGALSINDASVNNASNLFSNITTGASRFQVNSGGGTQADVTVGSNSVGTTKRYAGVWMANAANAYLDGTAGTLDTSVTVPVSFTTVSVGTSAAAGFPLNGCVRDIRIWQRVLSDSEVQAL